MADAVSDKGLSIPHDELAELRAKKQRQLATTPIMPPALPTAPALVAQTQEAEPPVPVAPPAVSTPSTPRPTSSATSSTTIPKARRARAASPRPDRAGQVIISSYFPIETRRRLKIVAAKQDITLQQVMADAFEAWLRRHDKDG